MTSRVLVKESSNSGRTGERVVVDVGETQPGDMFSIRTEQNADGATKFTAAVFRCADPHEGAAIRSGNAMMRASDPTIKDLCGWLTGPKDEVSQRLGISEQQVAALRSGLRALGYEVVGGDSWSIRCSQYIGFRRRGFAATEAAKMAKLLEGEEEAAERAHTRRTERAIRRAERVVT